MGIFGRNSSAGKHPTDDELAVARYEEVLRTADPDDLERAHTEAFEKLTPEQRDLMFEQLLERATEVDERPVDAEPRSLGKTATLLELRRPGTIKSILTGPAGDRLWADPNHTFYIAFAAYFLSGELALTLWGTDVGADPGAAAYGGDDAGFTGYPDGGSGGFDGGFGGGFGGDGGGGAF